LYTKYNVREALAVFRAIAMIGDVVVPQRHIARANAAALLSYVPFSQRSAAPVF